MTSEVSESTPTPTLEMVAARAGVSRATASRVVNGSPKVTPEVAEAVRAAIDALNYVPNRAARSLASRRTQMIALVIPESTAMVFADPFFASIVQGIAMYLAETEYTLNMLIAVESKPDKTRQYLISGNVDGALIVSHHSGDHSYAHLEKSLPVVFAGRPLLPDAQGGSYFVGVDDIAGERIAVEHLIGRGRRSVAAIAGPQDMPPGVDRLEGWRRAVQDRGLDETLVEFGDFTPASGADAMRRLLDRGIPIDAVVVANDQMAMGAYTTLRERGLRIPEDVAVVGFDDNYFGLTASPPLTTVHQPSVELGRAMAEVLVKIIEGHPVDQVTILPTELVVRESS
ncbi:MAG TPA: LacI family DNA-binding transcriptional regulator [Lacisediminihabitans sp.]|uniref:LacI family DNA-binding transcriptional regulator n=1 Tax=Lacisediminihabitans sp. TaxID=2787631 RepID=UPI002EDB8075